MALVRALFFFKDSSGKGWSEGIYNTSVNLTEALTRAATLAHLRVQLLGRGCHLTNIRVSDEAIKRDSRVFAVPLGDQTVRGTVEDWHDAADLALNVRFDADETTARGRVFFAGLRDKWVQAGVWSPDGTFTAPFNRWKAALLADGWAIKVKGIDSVPVGIASMIQLPGENTITVTTVGAHGFAANNHVSFSGATGPGVPRGIYMVKTVPTPSTFTIITQALLGIVGFTGTVRKLAWTLRNITEATPVKLTTRKRGGPFDRPVGRRRRRVRA